MYSVVPFVSASSLFLSLALLFACRTVLQRKMVVTFHDVSLRKVETLQCGRKKKYSVTKEVWEQVCAAAVSKYPIAKLQHQGTKDAAVLFAALPDEGPSRMQFHNHLVESCQVSVRAWTEALNKQQVKERKRPPAD